MWAVLDTIQMRRVSSEAGRARTRGGSSTRKRENPEGASPKRRPLGVVPDLPFLPFRAFRADQLRCPFGHPDPVCSSRSSPFRGWSRRLQPEPKSLPAAPKDRPARPVFPWPKPRQHLPSGPRAETLGPKSWTGLSAAPVPRRLCLTTPPPRVVRHQPSELPVSRRPSRSTAAPIPSKPKLLRVPLTPFGLCGRLSWAETLFEPGDRLSTASAAFFPTEVGPTATSAWAAAPAEGAQSYDHDIRASNQNHGCFSRSSMSFREASRKSAAIRLPTFSDDNPDCELHSCRSCHRVSVCSPQDEID